MVNSGVEAVIPEVDFYGVFDRLVAWMFVSVRFVAQFRLFASKVVVAHVVVVPFC
jgi:hypothetical protein